MPNEQGVDMTKAAVSRGEIVRKNGMLQKVKKGTGAKDDDVLMSTTPDFAVLGNSYDPEWGMQYKQIGAELEKKYNKNYISGDAISDKTEELNTKSMNEAVDELLQRQEMANQMSGKTQQYQNTDDTSFAQANGGYVPRYELGSSRPSYLPGAFTSGLGALLATSGGLSGFLPGGEGESKTRRILRGVIGSALGAGGLGLGAAGIGQMMNAYQGRKDWDEQAALVDAMPGYKRPWLHPDWKYHEAPPDEQHAFDRDSTAIEQISRAARAPQRYPNEAIAEGVAGSQYLKPKIISVNGEPVNQAKAYGGTVERYEKGGWKDREARNKYISEYGMPQGSNPRGKDYLPPEEYNEFMKAHQSQQEEGEGWYSPKRFAVPGLQSLAGLGGIAGGIYSLANVQNPFLKYGLGAAGILGGAGLAGRGLWNLKNELPDTASPDSEFKKNPKLIVKGSNEAGNRVVPNPNYKNDAKDRFFNTPEELAENAQIRQQREAEAAAKAESMKRGAQQNAEWNAHQTGFQPPTPEEQAMIDAEEKEYNEIMSRKGGDALSQYTLAYGGVVPRYAKGGWFSAVRPKNMFGKVAGTAKSNPYIPGILKTILGTAGMAGGAYLGARNWGDSPLATYLPKTLGTAIGMIGAGGVTSGVSDLYNTYKNRKFIDPIGEASQSETRINPTLNTGNDISMTPAFYQKFHNQLYMPGQDRYRDPHVNRRLYPAEYYEDKHSTADFRNPEKSNWKQPEPENPVKPGEPEGLEGLAYGGTVPRYAEGTPVQVPQQLPSESAIAMSDSPIEGVDPEIQKRMRMAKLMNMQSHGMHGLAQMMGLFNQDTTPDRATPHYVGTGGNPYTALIQQMMMQNMPNMNARQADANNNLQQMMKAAKMTNQGGARNMALANAMMTQNSMLSSAQREIEQARMQQSQGMASTLASLGGQNAEMALNIARENANEDRRIDDLNSRSDAAARQNKLNNMERFFTGMGDLGNLGITKEDIKAKSSALTDTVRGLWDKYNGKTKDVDTKGHDTDNLMSQFQENTKENPKANHEYLPSEIDSIYSNAGKQIDDYITSLDKPKPPEKENPKVKTIKKQVKSENLKKKIRQNVILQSKRAQSVPNKPRPVHQIVTDDYFPR